jgi:hypothetical protein
VGRPGISRGSELTHEETDETPVIYNSKDIYFYVSWSQLLLLKVSGLFLDDMDM